MSGLLVKVSSTSERDCVSLTGPVASNGLEALEKIRRVSTDAVPPQGIPFDCILMDLEMPGGSTTVGSDAWLTRAVMDGLTAVRHIREEEAAGTLTQNLVIALSEYLTVWRRDDATN